MGNVDEINPNAKVYNDLSKEEKALYKDNLVSEYIDYYKDFELTLDKNLRFICNTYILE